MTAVVKEYYEGVIDMRSPWSPNARPVPADTVCILRFEDSHRLSEAEVTQLFNIAAKDYGFTSRKRVMVCDDHIQFGIQKPNADYKRLGPRIVASVG
jgi:hypothetical protein